LQDGVIGISHRPIDMKNRRQSVKALKWIQFKEQELNIEIQSKHSGGEKKIGRYFVDGFCGERNEIFEFYGCHWHGCLKCNRPETSHPHRDVEMSVVYKETVDRQAELEGLGFKVTAIWEHEYEELRKSDDDFREYVDNAEIKTALQPRDAFKGGRVNAFKLLHNIEKEEKIFYYDVTSGKKYFSVDRTKH